MKREIKFRAFSDISNRMYHISESEDLWSFLRRCHGMDLMQYTGLKDKNGVEIYEGDLLKGETETFEVYYDTQNSSFRIVTRVLNKEHKFDTVRYSFPDNLGNGYLKRRDLEVIGNIHQNHELL